MLKAIPKLPVGLIFLFLHLNLPAQTCTQPFRIVLMGSSTTAGKGAKPIDSSWARKYAAYLQSINGSCVVTNLAVSGYTTYQGQPGSFIPPAGRPKPDKNKNITMALSLKPNAIIINYPSNDAVANYTLTEQQNNFKRITDEAGKANVPVWVTTTQPRNNLTAVQLNNQRTMRDWIKSYYKGKSIDFWTGLNSAKDSIAYNYNSGDGIHVNNAGHTVFFNRAVAENVPDTLCTVLQKCLKPAGLKTNNIGDTYATTRWNNTGALSYNLLLRLAAVSVWQIKNTTKDSMLLSGLKCSSAYVYQVQPVCGSNILGPVSQGTFSTLACTTFDTTCGVLPAGIQTRDVGTVSIPGLACYIPSTGTYRLKGAGDDIIKYSDNFRYVYKTFTGDGAIDVKVISQDNSDTANQAGIMFRESLAAGARKVFIGLTSSSGAFVQYRGATGAATSQKLITGLKAPYFVRITKSDSVFSSYTSADGVNWRNEKNISLGKFGNGSAFYAGLAINSHKKSLLMQAAFNNWHINIVNLSAVSPELKNVKAERIKTGFTLKVYPNPATDFNIDFNVEEKQDIFLAIIGIGDGRIYYKENVANFYGNYHKNFGRLRLNGGTYVITLKTNTGIKTVMLVKE